MSCFDHLCDQIQNPLSKQEDSSSSPFLPYFPSPFFDQHDPFPFNQTVLPHHYQHLMSEKNSNHCSTEKETVAKCSDNGVSKLKGKAPDQPSISTSTGLVAPQVLSSSRKPKKRIGKKDRHSKIRTAQGIRDRRMRLSLQAARKFFDLQDMLGYDKASKTIEWLFTKSKKAIRELMMNKDNPQKNFNLSTTSTAIPKIIDQCEVVSGILEENFSNNNDVEKLGSVPNDAKKSEKVACKTNTRESREKARARARCRTREKMMIKFGLENLSQLCYKYSSPNDILEKLGSCSDSPCVDQERVSTYGGGDYPSLLVSHKLADDVGTIEKLLENSNSSTTSCAHVTSDHCCDSAGVSCFVDHDSSFMGFLGNWDLFVNNERLNSNNQLCAVTNEVQFGGSPNSVYSTTPDFPLFHQ